MGQTVKSVFNSYSEICTKYQQEIIEETVVEADAILAETVVEETVETEEIIEEPVAVETETVVEELVVEAEAIVAEPVEEPKTDDLYKKPKKKKETVIDLSKPEVQDAEMVDNKD